MPVHMPETELTVAYSTELAVCCFEQV